MGLFADKLLLKLTAASLPDGELQLHIEKSETRPPHLLPFSGISLVAGQLTVLTERHPKSLCKRLLHFIEFTGAPLEPTTLISGFDLELYEGGAGIYNKFNPVRNPGRSLINDDLLQTEIEQTLLNYAIALLNQAEGREKSAFRFYLLMMIRSYQMEIIPVIRQTNLYDARQRRKLDNTTVFLATLIFRNWNEPEHLATEHARFLENLSLAKAFDAYLM
ncbi:hypothetical protein LARV_00111 [Longilinea arvoryzae]|uniref:Uncharacterized protein n=1 Tax=Longilinea arvoryzae TaxID=360412 RepID=A0A0S7BBD3_9CHLR|nr:hypothetical protein [Longilinea arvoryzae]GAP12377.1 hypothetical protein LARV_00111 [Longilinea arvoryzae]